MQTLLDQGFNQSEVARRLGVTPATVCLRIKRAAGGYPKKPPRDRTVPEVIARALVAFEARNPNISPKCGRFTDDQLHALLLNGVNLRKAGAVLGVTMQAVRARIRLWQGVLRDRTGPPIKQQNSETNATFDDRLRFVRARALLAGKKFREQPGEKAKRLVKDKARLTADPVFRAARNKSALAYYYRNSQKQFARTRARRHSDINFRLSCTLRSRVSFAMRIYKAKKYASTFKLAGCSVPEVASHLESKFTLGMSWDNYATDWVVDHKIPVCAFDLTCPLQQVLCFHFSNLQPLGRVANMEKIKHDRAMAKELGVPWHAG